MENGLKMLNLLAGIMPMDLVIDQLKKDIATWEADKTPANIRRLGVSCMLVSFKDAHSQSKTKTDGIAIVNDQLTDAKEMSELMNRMKGN